MYNVVFMYVFSAVHYALVHQLACSSLWGTASSASRILSCIGNSFKKNVLPHCLVRTWLSSTKLSFAGLLVHSHNYLCSSLLAFSYYLFKLVVYNNRFIFIVYSAASKRFSHFTLPPFFLQASSHLLVYFFLLLYKWAI